MQLIEEKTGLNSTKQVGIGALTLGLLYLGAKVIRNRVPSETSLKKSLNVVIIGASRGIGLSMARQFLRYGDNVIIASSSQSSIEKAYQSLNSDNKESTLFYTKCDVTNAKDLEQLFEFALKTFTNNKIDIIINNFGIDSTKRDFLWNISCQDITKIVNVNLNGMLLSNKLSIKSYINSKQESKLHIFNMSGAGTDGMTTPRFTTYGATKGGFLNIMNSVNKELKIAKLNNKIFIHSLSPGMVWTNLMANKENIDNNEKVISDPKSYWVLNALCEDTEVVTNWMVPKIRGVVTMKNVKGGIRIDFLTKYNAIPRMIGAAFFGYNKERFIDKNGMATQQTK